MIGASLNALKAEIVAWIRPVVLLLGGWGMMLGLAGKVWAEETFLQSPKLRESSGVAASADSQAVFTHNDSGDRARLYAFRRSGDLACEMELENAGSIDWEDICSFSLKGQEYLAIGDVGDNRGERERVDIYVIKALRPSSFPKPRSVFRFSVACRFVIRIAR